MASRSTYLVRVRLPDRPGTLGVVASRFGALKGDVIGIEIIERSGGLAVDELLVSLPAEVPLDLMVRELVSEDGVEIEDIRFLDGSDYDPKLEVLDAASLLVEAGTVQELAVVLAETVGRIVRLSWACVVDHSMVSQHGHAERQPEMVRARWGDPPDKQVLQSFVSENSPSELADAGVPTGHFTMWIPLSPALGALMVGRDSLIRAKERQRVAALARVADAWLRRCR